MIQAELEQHDMPDKRDGSLKFDHVVSSAPMQNPNRFVFHAQRLGSIDYV